MPKHNHALCLTPAKRLSTIVGILSLWHFGFPRTDALAILRDRYEGNSGPRDEDRAGTAHETITATANSENVDDLLADLYQYVNTSKQPATRIQITTRPIRRFRTAKTHRPGTTSVRNNRP